MKRIYWLFPLCFTLLGISLQAQASSWNTSLTLKIVDNTGGKLMLAAAKTSTTVALKSDWYLGTVQTAPISVMQNTAHLTSKTIDATFDRMSYSAAGFTVYKIQDTALALKAGICGGSWQYAYYNYNGAPKLKFTRTQSPESKYPFTCSITCSGFCGTDVSKNPDGSKIATTLTVTVSNK